MKCTLQNNRLSFEYPIYRVCRINISWALTVIFVIFEINWHEKFCPNLSFGPANLDNEEFYSCASNDPYPTDCLALNTGICLHRSYIFMTWPIFKHRNSKNNLRVLTLCIKYSAAVLIIPMRLQSWRIVDRNNSCLLLHTL